MKGIRDFVRELSPGADSRQRELPRPRAVLVALLDSDRSSNALCSDDRERVVPRVDQEDHEAENRLAHRFARGYITGAGARAGAERIVGTVSIPTRRDSVGSASLEIELRGKRTRQTLPRYGY